jgi:hypothetical protein
MKGLEVVIKGLNENSRFGYDDGGEWGRRPFSKDLYSHTINVTISNVMMKMLMARGWMAVDGGLVLKGKDVDAGSSDNYLISEPPDTVAFLSGQQTIKMIQPMGMLFQMAMPPVFSVADPTAKMVHMMPLHLVRLKMYEPLSDQSGRFSGGNLMDMSAEQTATLNHFLASLSRFVSSIGLVASGGAVQFERFIRGVLYHTGYLEQFMLPFDPAADDVMGTEKQIEKPRKEEKEEVFKEDDLKEEKSKLLDEMSDGDIDENSDDEDVDGERVDGHGWWVGVEGQGCGCR